MTHPHAQAAKNIDPNGLAMMLRTGTHDLHEQAESGAFQQRMVDGKLLREEYVAFLQQLWLVHSAMEPHLRHGAESEPRLQELLHDDHFRLDKIEQDLADLGAKTSDQKLGSTQRFIDYVAQEAANSPLSLVGVLYVNEGATNGNKVVAKRLREGLELDEGVAMRYLDPHGAEQRPRWMAFRAGLDALEMTEAEKTQCVEAARATFRLFMDLSAELAGDAIDAA